jgi:methyl-accepting chemotaxis protein
MRNITIRARIILLICVSVLFSALIGGAFLYEMLQLKDFSIDQTQQAMLEGQKERLKLSVHAMALSLGESLKDDESVAAKVERVRRATKPIIFEADKSGYFFVYEGTVVVSMPVKV